MNKPIPAGTPKGCLLCHTVDSLGIAVVCPSCGEATWAASAPDWSPLAPTPEPKAKGKGRK